MHHAVHQTRDLARDKVSLLTSRYSLPISKLRGVPSQTRALLKRRRVTTCA
jgi:hypothetical protein